MASSSRVHTVHDNAAKGDPQPSQENNQPASGQAGTSAKWNSFDLPPPQAPPAEAPKPPSQEEFKEKYPKPSKEDIQAYEKALKLRQTWVDYLKDKEDVENKCRKEGEETIFTGQNIKNRDEAVRDLMDEIYLVVRTDAEFDKRRAAFECE
jgi:hypothetical protein